MSDDYQRIAAAIHFLRDNRAKQPSLAETARHLGLSPYHFQRLFKRFAGVSPKRFLQHLTCEQAKRWLAESTSVMEASFAAGVSGPGRLHDLLINVEAITPGQFRSAGEGLTITWGCHPTPFGEGFIAVTERGICRLEFIGRETCGTVLRSLQNAWPQARFREDHELTAPYLQTIFKSPGNAAGQPLPLLLKGTNFQLQVWQALLRIPPGCVTSYGILAKQLGQPQAVRALGAAVGRNPIGYLIPCHRVLRADGGIGGYHWGIERKLAILGRELTAVEDC